MSYTLTAFSVDGVETHRSPTRPDTPRPDARNVVLYTVQDRAEQSGFRFWDDLNGDGEVQNAELGIVRSGNSGTVDFFVDRDVNGDLFLNPVRAGTGVEYADPDNPVEDLTSIDYAPNVNYPTSGLSALPGWGYVFEMDGGDGFSRYGAVRVTHVGQDYLILDWAFQTDPGNPELIRAR
jgi:hypothetical protein